MRFAPEGLPFIGGALVLSLVLWGAGSYQGGGSGWRVAFALAAAATLFTTWFFRDPDPRTPEGAGLVVSPGQGKIIDIREMDEPAYMGGRARRITIFLNVFDVHVQRSPVDGTVEYRHYKPGTYAVAWLEKASEDNEQASLGIRTPSGKVLVRQIAGLVARRIVTDQHEGEDVSRGQRIGLIRFGSRVDLFIPLDWEVTTEVGARVIVGRTVLARQPSGDPS
ncbi:MAG: phosphatidylserine decarboxylase family protein [Gemmatimonadota bacterium]|nr:phosphatidylserine decarboxylase family protein [Gemmatimonadota bacterium]MDH5758385.1 phosphatidylserine decarboxylase family protein [Gemmatimonadota bacterium]